jgi:hypothetical protein
MLQVKEEKRVEKGILSSKYSRTVSAKISFHFFTDARWDVFYLVCFLLLMQLRRVKRKTPEERTQRSTSVLDTLLNKNKKTVSMNK